MDRNRTAETDITLIGRSLSARRAWIEMACCSRHLFQNMVALRKESVDRNLGTMQIVIIVVVALRKESVDRNMMFACIGFH